jgi:O-antigen ligase
MTLSIIFVVLTMIIVALSGSRGSALSLVVVLLAFSFRKPVRPWGIVGWLTVIVVTLVAPFILDTLARRFAEEDGGEFGGRDLLWKASFQLIGDYFWTGVGVGNGRIELPEYLLSLTTHFKHRITLSSHNPILDIGVETGVPGLVLYLAVLLTAFWQFYRSSTQARKESQLATAYYCIILATGAGYLTSWIKSGGMDSHPTFFLLLALLTIPWHLLPDGRADGRDKSMRS